MGADWTEFDREVYRWRVGEIEATGLPDAAARALVSGCDGSALTRLAGMEGRTWSELEPVVERTYLERGSSLPSVENSVTTHANGLLAQLIDGEVDEIDAATRIAALSRSAGGWRSEFLLFSALVDQVAEVDAGWTSLEELRSEIRDHAIHIVDDGEIGNDVGSEA